MDPTVPLQWSNHTCILKKYKSERDRIDGGRTGNIVKVVQNNHVRLPARFTEEPLLLYAIKSHRKVISQCVESYDFITKDTVFTKQRFSIPLTYPGWFEVLNEDGKAVHPMTHIWELVEGEVESFLMRSSCKAFTNKPNNEPNFEKTRTIAKDEVMTMIGKITAIVGWRKKKVQLLHCLDEQGRDVYFDYKTQGVFSAVAGPNNISGVHKMEKIVESFRFPITVKVVAGKIPQTSTKGSLPGVFRLLDVVKDQMAFFLPLYSSLSSISRLVPISVRTPIELQSVTNMNNVFGLQDYKALLRICKDRMEKYFETIQMLISTDTSYETFPPRRSSKKRKEGDQRAFSAPVQRTEEDVLFEEVDDLYDYVRRGGDPPKPRPRTWTPALHMAGNNLTIAGKSPHTNTITHCKSQPDLSLPPLSPVEICDPLSPPPTPKSPAPPLLDSNGKKRGKLAMLTNGRFNKHKESPLKHATSIPSVSEPSLASGESSYATCPRRKRYYENIELTRDEENVSVTIKKQTVSATHQRKQKPEVQAMKPKAFVSKSLGKQGGEKELVFLTPHIGRGPRPNIATMDWNGKPKHSAIEVSRNQHESQGSMGLATFPQKAQKSGSERLEMLLPSVPPREDKHSRSAISQYTNSNEARLSHRETLVQAIRTQLIAKNLIVVDKPSAESASPPPPPARKSAMKSQAAERYTNKFDSDDRSNSEDSDDKTMSSKSDDLSRSTNLSQSTSDLVKVFETMKDSSQSSEIPNQSTETPLAIKVVPQSYNTFHGSKDGKMSAPIDYNTFHQNPGREYTPRKLSAGMQQRIVMFQGINA